VTSGPGPDGAQPRAARAGAEPAGQDGAQPAAAQAGAKPAGQDRPGPGRGPPSPAGPGTPARARRVSAGIYGTIVTAAILASAGTRLPTTELAVSVLVTLTVYWVAEEYADLLGGQIAGARLPGWRHIRSALVASWAMVSASYLPLLVLLIASAAGAADTDAASAALVAAAVELVLYALAAGRAAALRGRSQLVITALAAVLGLAMIALKVLVLTHLH
jgi:hypothetical protein